MKKIILSAVLLLAISIVYAACRNSQATNEKTANTTAQVAEVSNNKETRIQVAILLDTSGSMHGLIDQAKSRLWNIVNTLTTLKYNGKEPVIEIALYEYGSYNRYKGDYLRQITPLTTDLDLISQELFRLETGGSEEYCGTVIHRAVRELEWGNLKSDMKLIYIAGNEVFEQGKISYRTAIPQALERDIYVNTIHCGNSQTGIRDLWKDAANLGKGKFFNIDHNAKVRYIETPFDDEISACNTKLNNTYIGYGEVGNEMKIRQVQQDANAQSISASNQAERAVSKSKAAYKNSSWDLVDMVKKDESKIAELKEEALPAELKNKSKEEIKAFITAKDKERESIKTEINELAAKRQAYIDKAMAEEENEDDLGNAISQSVISLAQTKGYSVE